MKKTTNMSPLQIASAGNGSLSTQVNNKHASFGWLKMLPLLLLLAMCGMITSASATNYYKNAAGLPSTTGTAAVSTGTTTNWYVSTDSLGTTNAYTAAVTPPTGNDVLTISGAFALTIPAAGFTVNSGGAIHARSTVTPVITTGALTFGAGAVYEFNNTTTTVATPIPLATWSATSTIFIVGAFTNDVFFAGLSTQHYGNVYVNVAAGTGAYFSNLQTANATLNFDGNFTIAGSTTTLKFFNTNLNLGLVCTINVLGNFNLVSGSVLALGNQAGNNFIYNFSGNVSGILPTGSSPGSTTTVNLLGTNNTIDWGTGGTFLNTGRVTSLNISGNYTLLSNLGGYITYPYTNINVSGTLDCAGFTVSGSGSVFTLASGATLKTTNTAGFNASGVVPATPSSAITTTFKNFNTGANYEFDGTTGSTAINTSATTAVGIVQATNATTAAGVVLQTTASTASTSIATNNFSGAITYVTSAATAINTAVLTFPALATGSVVTGQYATGSTSIPAGTTVLSVSGNTVTLSANVTVAITAGTSISFGNLLLTTSAVSTASTTLNFASSISATGIANGQTVTGTGIPAGTTVQSFTATTVVINNSVTVSSGAKIMFTTAVPAPSTILSFGNTLGVFVGQTVTGTNIPANTTVSSLTATTVTMSAAATSTGTATATTITFGGVVLTFASTTGVVDGQVVTGVNIPNNTTVSSHTGTTVTLSAAVTVAGGMQSGQNIYFGGTVLTMGNTTGVANNAVVTGTNIPAGTIVLSFVANTSVTLSQAVTGSGISSGQNITFAGATLTFASTTGAGVGQPVSGTNIPAGTTVASLTSTTVILSAPVSSGITSGQTITFSTATGAGVPSTVNNLIVNNSSGLTLTQPTTVSGTLSLTAGAFGLNGQSLTLGNSASITRSGGTIASAPTFGTAVNVTYAQNGSSITTGSELPTSTSALNNLIINTTNGVTLGAAATVNGTLTLTGSNLSLGNNNLTLNKSNAVGGTPSTSNHILTGGSGYVTTTGNFSTAYTFPVGYNATSYNPVAITPTNQNPTVIAQARGTSTATLTNSLNAQWVIGGLTASAAFSFPWNNPNDLSNTSVPPTGGLLYYYSSSWTSIPASSTTGTTTTFTGIPSSYTLTVGPNTVATLSLSSTAGTTSQSVNINTAITNITYAYGGASTGTTITWTGTASSSTPPTGISIGSASGTTTISGTPSVVGNYGYSVVNVGGTALTPLTGTITAVDLPTLAVAAITSVGSANVLTGFSNYPITNFSVQVTTVSASITGLNLPITTNGLVSGDLTNYKLFYTTTSTAPNYSIATPLATVSSSLATSPIGFSFSQTINSGSTGYFWVTMDVSASATSGHTVTAGSISTSSLTYTSSYNTSGSAVAAGGTQTIAYPVYYNVSGADLSSLSNWGTNTNGSGSNPPNFTNPNATFNINNGTTNTLGGNLTISGSGTIVNLAATAGLTISSTYTMTISTASFVIASGATITINGTFVNSGTVTNGTTSAKFIVNGTYQHNVDGSSVPIAAWNTGSTLNVTGMVGTNVGNMNQNFSNIIWNCSGQTANANWTWRNTAITISGNIQILASGTSSATVKVVGLTDGLSTTSNYTINGNVTISGNSTLSCNASSAASLIIGITVNGNFSIGSGSTYSFHAATLAQTNTLNIKGNFTNAGTLTSNNAGDANTLNFNGSSVQTYSNTGVITATLTGTSFIVASTSTLDVGATSTIQANIPFTLSSGATLQTANTGGVNGSILTASPVLSTTANYVFNGTSTQVNGALVITANNITINNSAGVSLGATTTVNGILSLTSGVLNLNGQTLSLGNSATISRSGGSISTAPSFGSAVNVTYAQNGSSITTSAEIPTSGSVLNNLTVSTTNGVTLGTAATVNGTLSLASNLTLGSNNLTLSDAHAVAGTPGTSNHIVTNGSGYVTTGVTYGSAYTFPVGYNSSSYNPVAITPVSEIPTVRVAAISPALTNSLKAMWTIGGITSSSTVISFPWVSGTDNAGTAQRGGMVYSYLSSSWGTAIDGTGTSGTSPNYTTNLSGVAIVNPSIFTVGPPSAAALALTSAAGTSAQIVNTSTSITDITYEWSGSATTATVSWTGTSGSSIAPTGITVSIDNVNNAVTISGHATVVGTYGYTVTTDGIPAAVKTGSISVASTPTVTLALVSAATTGNIFPGSTNNIITDFSLLPSTSSATLNGITIPITVGIGLASTELVNYKLYYTTSSTFSISSLLSTVTSALTTSPITFSSLSQTIASGVKGYFWVTVDLSNTAVLGHTLTANSISFSNLTFSLNVNSSGSIAAQGTQTITNPIYYNVNNSDISNLNNWGDNTDGSGLHPSNFTGSKATYNLNNGLLNTLTSTTTFSGSGSVLSIGSTAGLKINTGVTMTVSSATMTIISGGALTIAGTLINSGTVTNGTTSAKFIVNGTYQHNVDGGSVPSATWNTGSTLNVTGMAGTNIGQMNQNFYNIIWNCPSQSINANWTWRSNAIVIDGDIQILASGTTGAIKIIGLTDGLGTSPFNYTINGNVSISGNSYLSCNASSTVNLSHNITVNKNFTIYSGATYSFHAATSVQTQVLNIKGDFSNAGTITSNTATDNNTLNFNGTGTHTFSNTGTFTSTLSATTITVNSGNNVLVSSAATIPALTVNSGGTVTNNTTLNILFALTDNGTISGTGTIILSGMAAQTISGTGTVTNFTLNNSTGATVTSGSNNLGITGLLTMQLGQLTTNGNVTLKSTSIANTGILAPYGAIGNTGTISGTVNVERYIPAGYRAYRDIAPEVYNDPSSSTTKSIFYNWQEQGAMTSGKGVFITGSGAIHANDGYYGASYPSVSPQPSVNSTNGLDYSINGNPSAYKYTNGSLYASTNSGFVAIADTKAENLDVFSGYRVLVRGDRSFNLATTPIVNYYNIGLRMVNATTLRATGQLVTGTVTYSTDGIVNAATGINTTVTGTSTHVDALTSSMVNGFSMVANPYVCPVQWGTGVTATQTGNTNTVFGNSTNINGSYWYLDPTASAAGKYIAFNAITGNASVGGSTYAGNYNGTTNNGAGYIQPGQAFFVQSSSASPTVVFTETCKAASSTKTSVFGLTKPLSKIYVGLLKEDSVNIYTQKDGVAIAFATSFGNTTYGPQDALKFGNATDNIYIADKGKNLSIDGRLPATAAEVLPIALNKMSGKNYKLVVNAIDYDANGYIPVLKDNYRGTVKELSLGIDTITFTVDTAIAASIANRFSLGFKPTTLAVNSIVASATLNNKIATISWNTVGEKGVSRYEVEKSTDAKAFTKIGQATAKNTAIATYSTTDNSVTATTYYRIKAISEVGTVSYSNVAKVSTDNRLPLYSLYPNPLKGSKVVNVSLTNVTAGKYTVTITSVLGQKVHEEAINHQGGSASHAITITNTLLAAGSYSITVRDASNQSVYQSNISVQP